MNGGAIARFIYFWIFVLGGAIIARVLGMPDTRENIIGLLLALVLVYCSFMFFRSRAERKSSKKSSTAPVQNSSKSKKKKHKKKKH